METIINDLIRVNRCLSVSVEMMEGQGIVVVVICIDIGELCKLLALNIKVVLFLVSLAVTVGWWMRMHRPRGPRELCSTHVA